MRKQFLLSTVMLLCASSAVAAQPSQLDTLLANARFLAEHPAVAKIAPPSRLSVPMRSLSQSGMKAPAAAPQFAVPPVLWGNVIKQDTWTGTYSAYGTYSFNPTDPFSLKTLKTDGEQYMKGNGGAVAIGNRYYLTYWYMGMGYIVSKFITYDTDTWERISSIDTDDGGLCATDLAYDRINGICYGAFFTDDLSGWELGTIDFSSGYPSKTSIGSIPLMVAALAVNSKGELYGICEDGVLYKFDTTDASMTRIGDTGVKVAHYGGVTQQSGAFDQHSDIFYWSSIDAYGRYQLYSVSTADASVTRIADIPDRSQILNLQVLAPQAADKAPNFLQTMEASFPEGRLDGTVSFTTPSATYDGSSLTENLTYTVSVNGVVKATGTVAPDTQVSEQLSVSRGESVFEVWVENSVGRSPVTTSKMWTGPDVPSLTQVTYTADGNKSTVSWTPAPTGIHGGWTGDMTYNVVRMPDNVTVVMGTVNTSVTDIIPTDAPLARYWYVVTPVNAGFEGQAVSSNGNVVGDAVQPPYLQTFEDKSSFELMKVIDANKDGLTWEWGEQSWINKQGVASCGDQYSDFAPSWDDWLLTPFINLEEGKTYELTFKVKGICWDPDYISVAFGTGDDVSKYKTAMPPTKIGVLNNFEEYKTVINSTSNQKVRIGFHRTSDYSDATMQIDDIRLSEGSSQSAPASVSDLIVTPDSKGALSADVSLTAPSVDKSGNPLHTITKIDLYVNQTLSHTFENPTPGSTLTHTVTVPDNATYSIKAEAFNDSGVSESVVASAFIGVDIPGNFKAWIEDHQDHITVRWEPCTTGQNGRYVNPDEMLYDIYAVEAELMTDILASDINGTSFDMNFDTDQGAIGGIQVALRAKNSAGESRGVATDILIVGDSYELPYEEHFDGNSGYIYDGSQDQNFGLLEAASSDGDDKCFGYVAMNGSAPYMELRTMKIALAGAKSPYLTFDYLITSDARIEAYVLTPDRKFETVAVADQKSENPHWLTAVADLSKYTDERYVRLFFRFYKGDGMMDIVPMDNLHILDAFGNDLAVSLTLPQEPTGFGEHADIAVKVLNSGVNACPAYKVNFFAGEELIESQEGSSLDFMKSADHHFTYEVLPGTPEPLLLSAKVQYEADENPDNNTAVAELPIRQAKVSAPENLSASQSQGIKLQWDAPSTFYSERITEDFESYYPWTITNFGKWTLIDADGANVVQLEEADFPNEGKPQAFTIFNPSSIGVPDANTEANPHSGNQYAACFAAKVRETEHNDDWLISPLLPGKAQKIGFYAKQMISSFGPEKLQLLYSVTGNQIEDFKLIEEFEINNPDEWTLFRADLPEGSKYFAFRVVTRDGHLLMLDDVIFTAGSCTEIISYNIYRSGQRIAQVGAPMTMYTDSDGKPNDRYNVTAVYATGEESDFSNTATITSSVDEIRAIGEAPFNVYSIDGKIILLDADNLDSLEPGLYIVNNKKMFIRKNK